MGSRRRRRLAILSLMIAVVLIVSSGVWVARRRGAEKNRTLHLQSFEYDRDLGPNHADEINWDTLLYKTSRCAGGGLGAWLSRQTSCVNCHK